MKTSLEVRGVINHVIWSEGDLIIAEFLPDEGARLTIKGVVPCASEGTRLALKLDEKRHPKYGRQYEVHGFEYENPTASQLAVMEVREFLQETLGLAKRAQIIWDALGVDAKRIILENPYALAEMVHGIGFKIADDIAVKLGIELEDPRRLEEYILAHLKDTAMGEGHVFLRHGALMYRVREFFGLDDSSIVGRAITKLSLPREEGLNRAPRIIQFVKDGQIYVYERKLWTDEETVGTLLREHAASCEPFILPTNEYSAMALDGLTDEQVLAVKNVFEFGLSVITGGPGTGKTRIVRAIVDLGALIDRDLALAAPTGRAAKRMQELTMHEASTIHRLLAFNPQTGNFTFNRNKPLYHQIIVCDETSMLDIHIAARLIEAVRKGAHLVFVGDVNQLPPVGPGSFFADLIASDIAPTAVLTRNFRQTKGSRIIDGCLRILRSEMPIFGKKVGEDDLFRFPYRTPEEGLEMVKSLVMTKIPKLFGIDSDDIQVIAPEHEGTLGTENINLTLQRCLRKTTPGQGIRFVALDRVIQVKNNYNLNVMNGDVGFIVEIHNKGAQIRFGDEIVAYDSSALNDVELGYAITIHKSQGSEYPAVVIVTHTRRPGFFTQQMIYTAISRGAHLVVVVSPERQGYLEQIISTPPRPRNSRLRSILSNAEDEYEDEN